MYWNLDSAAETNVTEVFETFDEMNLREPLLRGIHGYGFERPSAIQQRAIKPCITGMWLVLSSVEDFSHCYYLLMDRSRCHCPSTIRHRQNNYLCHLDLTTTGS